jgi:hypothetical protein
MSYKAGFQNRYALGKHSEAIVLPLIKDFFKREIMPTVQQMAPHDYFCKDHTYELKTRTNSMKAYPTTMIGANKLNEDAVYLFQFTDCLAYIEYDRLKFAKYKTMVLRKYGPPVKNVLIPIEDLTVIQVAEPTTDYNHNTGRISTIPVPTIASTLDI